MIMIAKISALKGLNSNSGEHRLLEEPAPKGLNSNNHGCNPWRKQERMKKAVRFRAPQVRGL
jgi:hypothetical protein